MSFHPQLDIPFVKRVLVSLHIRFSHFDTHIYFDLSCPQTELQTAEKSRTANLGASLRLERKSKVYETLILPLDQLAIKEFYHITWITLNQAHQSHTL